MPTYKRLAREYFYFTTREKYGILGLFLIILFLSVLPYLVVTSDQNSLTYAQFEQEIALMQAVDSNDFQNNGFNPTNNSGALNPFYFDPNTVNPKELKRFGLPDYLINRFDKFRNSGFRFKQVADLKRIYGLNEIYFNRIAPFVSIHNPNSNNRLAKDFNNSQIEFESENNDFNKGKAINYGTFKHKTNEIIELNTADSNQLITVKGIGPYLASKIIKYRNALGGFVQTNQLSEIYNVSADQIAAFLPFVTVNPNYIRKLNINTAGFNDLNAHPYISSAEAKAIIKFRSQHGTFQEIGDLQKMVNIKPETLTKIGPYLGF